MTCARPTSRGEGERENRNANQENLQRASGSGGGRVLSSAGSARLAGVLRLVPVERDGRRLTGRRPFPAEGRVIKAGHNIPPPNPTVPP